MFCLLGLLVALVGTALHPVSGQTPGYVFIGCFYDSNRRPLNKLVKNLRGHIDWKALKKTVDSCATQIKKEGYEYFGVQFYGECWSGKDAATSFAKVGPAPLSKCGRGVGTSWVNAVYRLVNLPPCSSDLQYKPLPSSGTVQELTWCSNETSAKLEMSLGYPTRVTGIGMQGKYPDKWMTSFTLEYSEGEMFVPYVERGLIRIFQGNSNWYDLKIIWLVNPSEGTRFRIVPKTWTPYPGPVCARFRLFGCRLH
ncbi:uncharacterized protein LOC110234700 [Exaiptasia diaphana]|uniref:F5/8 type C domain-containing protein n=1 Tax=Exaiptasia diaphana TaxID=2652724 RepID=A0A913WXQ0_EXADI|nr:uncharacterized protein LOC110234700 [Exaiptasia diaphana]KXJ17026.1 Contactin-associated protein like 5-3 [Exaiptasia diaphana]